MIEKQLFSAPESWKNTIKWVFQTWTRGLASLTVAVYVLGFVVVHSHLSQYGVYDFEFGNIRYLYGGGIFIFYLTIGYLTAGRACIAMIKYYDSGTNSYIKYRGINLGLIVFALMRMVNASVGVAFNLCLASVIFYSFFLPSQINFIYYACVTGAFIIDYFVILRVEHRWQKICEAISIVVKFPAVFIFFYTMSDWNLGFVFFFYAAVVFYLSLVSETIEKNKKEGTNVAYTGIFTILMVLVLATSFGRILYGEIPRSFGGGQPLHADIQIREEYSSMFPSRKNSTSIDRVKIIHITDKYIYIEENGEIVRVPDYSIIGMKHKQTDLSLEEIFQDRNSIID